ncbi:MAG: winged helix-turn-helix domain-containing protein [Acidobacteriota bacterium]
MTKDFSGAPQFVKYFAPVLDALEQLGGSGRPDEVRSVIAQRLKLSEEQQSEQLPSKAQPRSTTRCIGHASTCQRLASLIHRNGVYGPSINIWSVRDRRLGATELD